MTKLKIFCVTNKQVPALENSNFILSGVVTKFNEKYIVSNYKDNIFLRTILFRINLHYWYWKNLLQEEDAEWIGFCQEDGCGSKVKKTLKK